MRIGNATRATTPIASEIHASGSCHCWSWPRIAPNASPPTAMTPTTAPSQSKLPGRALGLASRACGAIVAYSATSDQRDVDQERGPPAHGVDEQAADDGPDEARRRRRGRPDAERAGPRLALEQRREDRQRARDEQRAGRALEEPEHDQQLEGRREAAQDATRSPKPDEADREDLPPAVVVGEGAGEDQQRGEDREVAADGVGLALEHATTCVAGSSSPIRGRARFMTVPSRKTIAEPEDGRDHGPALGRVTGHRRGECRRRAAAVQSGRRRPRSPDPALCCGRCPDPWRSSAPVSSSHPWPSSIGACSPRPVATGRASSILPTASAPDGEATFRAWAEMGVEHFAALGRRGRAGARPRPSRRADDAAAIQAIGEADLVYLSGGHPALPARGPAAGRRWARRSRGAHARGAVVAGCSAGAMAIVGRTHGLPARPEAADAAAVPDPLARPGSRWSTGSPCCRTTTPGRSRCRGAARAPGAARVDRSLGIDEERRGRRAGTARGRSRRRSRPARVHRVWRGEAPAARARSARGRRSFAGDLEPAVTCADRPRLGRRRRSGPPAIALTARERPACELPHASMPAAEHRRRAGRPRQSGLIWRKQSEQ